MIESLQTKHIQLQQETVEARPKISDVLIEKIKNYITDCIEAGTIISNLDDRSELRSILNYWVNIIYEATHDLSYLSLQIKAPVLGVTLLRLTFEDLVTNCQKRANQFVFECVRNDIFKPQQAIRREQIENQFWDFLRSDKTGLVVTGPSGVGKTFLICQLAEQKPYRKNKELAIILPYDCRQFSVSISPLDRELEEIIKNDIAHSLGIDNIPSLLEMESNYIDELLEQHSAYLLICFDSIESFIVNRIEKPGEVLREVPMAREFLLSLNNIIKTFALHGITRIKFLLTCVNSTWVSLGPDRLVTWSLYYAPRQDTRSLRIDRFNTDELRNAMEVYHVSEEAREEIPFLSEGNPYILRLASELIVKLGNAKKITEDLLFREFYSRRVLRGTQHEKIRKQHFLLEFAKKAKKFIKESQNSEWGVTSEDIDPDDPVYKSLELDGIISQEMIREPSPQIVVKLNPTILVNYIQKWLMTDKPT